MPKKPQKPCPGRGPRRGNCRNLLKGSERCCLECEPYEKKFIKEYDKKRGSSGKRGYDWDWQKLRKWKLNRNPLCELCLKEGFVRGMDIVHHILSIETHPHLRLDKSNLQSLCNTCHERVHKDKRFGRKPEYG